MTQNTDFFADPLHRALQNMLLVVNKQLVALGNENKHILKTFHRPIYMLAGEIGLAVGSMASFGNFNGHYDVRVAQAKLAELWCFGLGWSIVRFGLDIDDKELVRAIARRVRIGQARAAADPILNTDIIDAALDKLIEKAGAGLFNYDAFFCLAHQLDLEGVDWLVKAMDDMQVVH